MSKELLMLPLEVQVALGGGYLAYALAYAGLRSGTSAAEMAFRSLAFGLIALLVFRKTSDIGWPEWVSVVLALCAAVLLGGLWRRWGMQWVRKIQFLLKVSREDGLPDAWTALIQTPSLNVTQLSVHTKDGRVLHHDRSKYSTAVLDGLYLGNDGAIVMVVAEEDLPDGSTEMREGIDAADWGTRVTYIPADQITRVNMRTSTTS